MASTTALFTGLSGLNAHSRKLDVIGNNIARVVAPAVAGYLLALYLAELADAIEPADLADHLLRGRAG